MTRALARLEGPLVILVALHSVSVGLALIFATEWGARLGGFDRVTPLFFARQAGIFHLVVATGYLLEYLGSRGVSFLLAAKTAAVVFLITESLLDSVPWVVPASAAGDALTALLVFVAHQAARRSGVA